MSFEFDINKESEQFEVYYRGKIIASLDIDQADDFSLQVKNAKTKFDLAVNEYDRIEMEHLHEALEEREESISSLQSIHLTVAKDAKKQRVETEVTLIVNADEEYVNVNLENCFKEEEVWFGVALNHEIRNCFHPDVLEFLAQNENITIWFNEQEVNRQELMDEEEDYLYDYGEIE